MSEPEPRCYRPDCVEHDYEARTCTLSREAAHAALASVFPHWYGEYETVDGHFWIDIERKRDPSEGIFLPD